MLKRLALFFLVFGAGYNVSFGFIYYQALGMETVFSNALTGCNLGAAVGGADFNPHNKSEAEIQRCVQTVCTISFLTKGSVFSPILL